MVAATALDAVLYVVLLPLIVGVLVYWRKQSKADKASRHSKGDITGKGW